jgi:hypothetical protein
MWAMGMGINLDMKPKGLEQVFFSERAESAGTTDRFI